MFVGAALLSPLVLVSGPAFAANPQSEFTYTIAAGAATITDYSGGPVVDIPATVIDGGVSYPVTAIGNQSMDSKFLTSVTIPDSVTTIGNAAFRNDRLATLVIPDSVTLIGGSAFRDNSLTRVTLGSSVDTIRAQAFAGNPSLSSVFFTGPPPTTITPRTTGGSSFDSGVTVVHYDGVGFTSPWNGYTTRAIGGANSSLALTSTGAATGTATVTVRDSTLATVAGIPVAFTVPAGVTASAPSCVSASDGTCSITLLSNTTGSYLVTATIGADPTPLSQSISFSAAPSPSPSAPAPSPSPSASSSPSPGPSPSPSTAGIVPLDAANRPELAATGVDASALVGSAVGLLVLGLVFGATNFTRRRTRH